MSGGPADPLSFTEYYFQTPKRDELQHRFSITAISGFFTYASFAPGGGPDYTLCPPHPQVRDTFKVKRQRHWRRPSRFGRLCLCKITINNNQTQTPPWNKDTQLIAAPTGPLLFIYLFSPLLVASWQNVGKCLLLYSGRQRQWVSESQTWQPAAERARVSGWDSNY